MFKTALPLKVAFCDDERSDREYFFKLCEQVKEKNEFSFISKEYETGDALLFDFADRFIRDTVDIVLLDIYMPGNSGVEVAYALRERGYTGIIIFITKSEVHWRDAFEVKAFHYITKDREMEERFMATFLEAAEEAQTRRGRSLHFSAAGEIRCIEVAKISHFEVRGNIVSVYYGEDQFEFTGSLKKIEDMLVGNEGFVRVSRSCLLACTYVEHFDTKKKRVIMKDGKIIFVATKHIPLLRKTLEKI